MIAANPINQAQAIVGGILGLLLLIAIGFGLWKVNDWRERAATAETAAAELSATAQATEATAGAYSDAQMDSQRVDIVVHQSRAEAARTIEALTHEDPAVAALRDMPVPPSLLNAWRARREARDRLATGPDRAGDDTRASAD